MELITVSLFETVGAPLRSKLVLRKGVRSYVRSFFFGRSLDGDITYQMRRIF